VVGNFVLAKKTLYRNTRGSIMVAAQGKRSMSTWGRTYFDKQRQKTINGIYNLPCQTTNVNWMPAFLPSMQHVKKMILKEENLLKRIASYHCIKRDTQLDGGRRSITILTHGSRQHNRRSGNMHKALHTNSYMYPTHTKNMS
jgi:hypothetical protein